MLELTNVGLINWLVIVLISQIYPLGLVDGIGQAALKPNSCVRVNPIKTFGLLYNATHAVGELAMRE